MYAWRAKIGLISQVGENMEHAFHIYAPQGVSICSTKLPAEKTIADEKTFWEQLNLVASMYREYDADAIAIGVELGAAVSIPDYDEKCQKLSVALGEKPVVTSGQAVVQALKALGCSRVAVLTPYTEEENRAVCEYLRKNVLQPVCSHGMDMREFQVNALPYEAADRDFLYKNARAMDCGDAQALLICGECLGTMEILSYLERDMGMPVVSSQQALYWSALRAARVNAKIPALGKLFTI